MHEIGVSFLFFFFVVLLQNVTLEYFSCPLWLLFVQACTIPFKFMLRVAGNLSNNNKKTEKSHQSKLIKPQLPKGNYKSVLSASLSST